MCLPSLRCDSRRNPVAPPIGRPPVAVSSCGMKQDKTDDRVSLEGLDPVAALKALLQVDPDAPPSDEGSSDTKSDAADARGEGHDR